jgi:hypothetical protein
MANTISTNTQHQAALPPDDVNNKLTVDNREDDPKMHHISVAGGTYTILVTGEQTGGRDCLIDCRLAAARHRIVTTSRRCSRSWTARSS